MLSELLIAANVWLLSGQNALDSGQQALQAGDLARAEQLFRQYLAQNPNSAEALSNLGAVCARREQFAEAVSLVRESPQGRPEADARSFQPGDRAGPVEGVSIRRREHLPCFLESYPQGAAGASTARPGLLETGDLRGAMAELEESYKLNPQDASILYIARVRECARRRCGSRGGPAAPIGSPIPAQAKLIEGLIKYRRGMFPRSQGAVPGGACSWIPTTPRPSPLWGGWSCSTTTTPEAIRLLERATRN